jgi:hypothetical protein
MRVKIHHLPQTSLWGSAYLSTGTLHLHLLITVIYSSYGHVSTFRPLYAMSSTLTPPSAYSG